MTERKRISLKLSDDQKTVIKEAIGKDAESLGLTVEELEERIAPWGGGPGTGI